MRPASVNEQESLLEFPCRFPIKIMGKERADFQEHVVGLISSHVGDIAKTDVTVRLSRKGNFLALTVTISAESREQLDDVYRSLTASERVLFVL
jgi:putative lipoic acid-binding regulatory protein